MSQKKIYCFGIINLDILVYPVNNWPDIGGLVQADHVIFVPGGTALNTALAINKIGINPVELLGCIGEDDSGKRILDYLSEQGLGVSGITRTSLADSGVCIVTIRSSSERSFIYSAGSNEKVDSFSYYLEQIEKGSTVHLGGVLDMAILAGDTLLEILKALKNKGCDISMDLAWDWRNYGWEALEKSFRFADLITLNEKEAINLTGMKDLKVSADKIYHAGCPLVIIKLGSNGAYLRNQDFEGVIPGFSVNAIDSTGAGDAFSGALLAALSRMESPLEAVIFANAAGACCVQKIGPIEGIRTYTETLKFIEDQKPSSNLEDVLNGK